MRCMPTIHRLEEPESPLQMMWREAGARLRAETLAVALRQRRRSLVLLKRQIPVAVRKRQPLVVGLLLGRLEQELAQREELLG
jgi:hypothetical protein